MTREEAEKLIDQVIDIAALAFDEALSSIWQCVNRIVILSQGLWGLGAQFRFSASESMDQNVNQELLSLSNLLREAIYEHCSQAFSVNNDITEDDRIAAIEYISRDIEGEDLTARLDRYVSDIKSQIEAYIAAGIYAGLKPEEVVYQYMIHIDSPLDSPLMKLAYSHKTDFLTPLIVATGITYGTGRYISPFANIKRLEQMSIIEGYDYALYNSWRRKGIQNYHVYRGSNYPCAICETMANRTYPITECVLPFHANCVCYAVPIAGART